MLHRSSQLPHSRCIFPTTRRERGPGHAEPSLREETSVPQAVLLERAGAPGCQGNADSHRAGEPQEAEVRGQRRTSRRGGGLWPGRSARGECDERSTELHHRHEGTRCAGAPCPALLGASSSQLFCRHAHRTNAFPRSACSTPCECASTATCGSVRGTW